MSESPSNLSTRSLPGENSFKSFAVSFRSPSTESRLTFVIMIKIIKKEYLKALIGEIKIKGEEDIIRIERKEGNEMLEYSH